MKQTFVFRESGIIPGIPNPDSADGMFHAGHRVEVDLDTFEILSQALLDQFDQKLEEVIYLPSAKEEQEGN